MSNLIRNIAVVENGGKKMAEWISMKDRLPPCMGQKVLVVNSHGVVSILSLWKMEFRNKWTWLDEQGHFKHTNDITHWMPLPEPPKDGTHKPKDCRYYTDYCFFGCNGGCLGTKEIDPCEGENCPRWKPKEENK